MVKLRIVSLDGDDAQGGTLQLPKCSLSYHSASIADAADIIREETPDVLALSVSRRRARQAAPDDFFLLLPSMLPEPRRPFWPGIVQFLHAAWVVPAETVAAKLQHANSDRGEDDAFDVCLNAARATDSRILPIQRNPFVDAARLQGRGLLQHVVSSVSWMELVAGWVALLRADRPRLALCVHRIGDAWLQQWLMRLPRSLSSHQVEDFTRAYYAFVDSVATGVGSKGVRCKLNAPSE